MCLLCRLWVFTCGIPVRAGPPTGSELLAPLPESAALALVRMFGKPGDGTGVPVCAEATVMAAVSESTPTRAAVDNNDFMKAPA